MTHNFLSIYTTNGTPFVIPDGSDIIPSLDASGCLTLFSMFHISQLFFQLLYDGKIVDTDCNVLFNPISCVIQDSTSRKIGTYRKVNGLF